MVEGIPGYYRLRVVNRITGVEITNDLPHLGSSWTVRLSQPGSPASSAVGDFTINLHPPISDAGRAAKPIYDQLINGYWLRVEAYPSPSLGGGTTSTVWGSVGGNPKQAGFIRGVDYATDHFTLTGNTDVVLALFTKPFQGEPIYAWTPTPASVNQFRSYMATTQLAVGDNFNPYTSSNYTSFNVLAKTAGSWSAATDDGLTTVTSSTGTGALLISTTGATYADAFQSLYFEAAGRLKLGTSVDVTNSGKVGVALSKTSTNLQDGILVYVVAKRNATTLRFDLDLVYELYVANALSTTSTQSNFLTNVDDPEGFIPLTIGLLYASAGPALVATVNGSSVNLSAITTSFKPAYPAMMYGTPASGTGNQAYFSSFGAFTRSDAFLSPANTPLAPAFQVGSTDAAVHSVGFWSAALNVAPTPLAGPTMLDMWQLCLNVEGFYWRYTPAAVVAGNARLGVVDFQANPGTNLTQSVAFRYGDNVASLALQSNADAMTASSQITGPTNAAGGTGGISWWHSFPTMTQIGVIQDQTLALHAPSSSTQRSTAKQVLTNKTATGISGSKTAVVMRDASTVDLWREGDTVTLDAPELGILNQSVRILSYTFTEGEATQTIVFDQYSAADNLVLAKRFQQSVYLTPLGKR